MARFNGHRLALLIPPLVLMGACGSGQKAAAVDTASPERIVQEIERLAGPSQPAAETPSPALPYNAPLPENATPVTVGSSRVYQAVAGDTDLVIRPMLKGNQAFIRLSGDEAPNQFSFTFELPPQTQFEKQPDGSVSVTDQATNLKVPMLKAPRTMSVNGDGGSYPTSFVVNDNAVALAVNLTGARYPVVAVLDWDDPLTQLARGHVPALDEAQDATADGPKRNVPNGYGGYYAGPNRLEIRLNNIGTVSAVDHTLNPSEDSNNFSPLIMAALSGADKEITEALRQAKVRVGNNDTPGSAELKNKCLAVTVPRPGFDKYLNRYAAIWAGQYKETDAITTPDGLKVQLNSCSPVKPPKKDPAPPPAKSSTPTPKPTPLPPATWHVSMDDLCRQFHGEATRSVYKNFNDPYSWFCRNSVQEWPITLMDIQRYCNGILPGSIGRPVEETINGWRCIRQ